ncbi:Flp pilus assembly complex ATPase component TadA [Candidatus Marsarchaeota archaeon]|nr:Flp pilus assembly complex ATPase component TadA [Candidatus Marsarchaeota archaeon]
MSEIDVVEDILLKKLEGKFVNVDDREKMRLIRTTTKEFYPNIDEEEIAKIFDDLNRLEPISKLIDDINIEDIMINNTRNIFVYDSKLGYKKMDFRIESTDELEKFVAKLKLYKTNEDAKSNIIDVHMPNGSRANLITSPRGYDITIRNFKQVPYSIIDLINMGELTYKIAARLWLYVDGFKVRPANILIGGMPGAGKTTLLNAMFSFFRPEQRIITMEETYELNTEIHENCINLETSEDLTLEDLVKNCLRMRPDTMVVGEVRGGEANDMLTAMNIGKIVMGTIHASTTRDIVNRLTHSPMDVPVDIVPIIDALVIISQVYKNNMPVRKITQISEISGIESGKVLLSDLYKFDFKTDQASAMAPSITYRDILSNMLGIPPQYILREEEIRAAILERLNKLGKTTISQINEIVRQYYKDPKKTLIDLKLVNA